MITLDITNDWNLVDVDNISGRLNVMWLTPEGVGISTRDYSHMTILNMICEKSNNHDFWNIEEIKKHNYDKFKTFLFEIFLNCEPISFGEFTHAP